MSYLFDNVHDFLIGIEYNSSEEDKGHFTIRRKVTMTELIEELQGFVLNGHHYPQFPARAYPEVVYAYDLNEKEDADVYGIVNNALIESLDRSENNGHIDQDN